MDLASRCVPQNTQKVTAVFVPTNLSKKYKFLFSNSCSFSSHQTPILSGYCRQILMPGVKCNLDVDSVCTYVVKRSEHRHADTNFTSASLFFPKHCLVDLPSGRLTSSIRVHCGHKLILLTAVSHRSTQRLLPHLFLSLSPHPPFGPPLGVTLASSLSGDLLYTEFPRAISPCHCSPPHFTPRLGPAGFIASLQRG